MCEKKKIDNWRRNGGAIVFCALIFALSAGVAFAADFHWTGAAGDHLWSTVGNWADSEGKPKDEGPQPGVAYTYNFTGYEHGLVVTQDVDVVLGSAIATHVTNGDAVAEVTWVSAPTCTMTVAQSVDVHCGETSRLVLNVDMKFENALAVITKFQSGDLVFDLKSEPVDPNLQNVPLVIYNGVVEVASTSANPYLAVKLADSRGSASSWNRVVPAFVNHLDGCFVDSLRLDGLNLGWRGNGRVDLDGTSLTVGYRNPQSWNLHHLPVPVFAGGGRLSLDNETTTLMYGLPVDGTLETVRGDAIVSNTLTTVRWTFDDPSDPTRDPIGYGSLLLAPKGMPAVVEDAERGHVLRFDGGRYFKGPDANAGFDPLFAGNSTNRPYTVAFWFKPDAVCDKLAKLFFWGTSLNGEAAALRLNVGNSETQTLMFTQWGGNQYVATPTNPMDGAWHHVAVTYDGGTRFAMYYDGDVVMDAYLAAGYSNPNQNFYLGAVHGGWCNNGQNPYTGLMDDLLVAAYALTSNDVARLREDGLAAFAPVTTVAAHDSGVATIYRENVSLASLSGDGVAGGVRTPLSNTVVRVEGGANAFASYSAKLMGADATLVKSGADFVQELGGRAENVTNVAVEAGVLRLRRPIARRGLVARYSFDDAAEKGVGFDSGVSGFGLQGDGVSSVADGPSGAAAHFDGSAWLSSGTAPFPHSWPDGDDSYSVSLWIRPTSAACTDETPLFCWGDMHDRRFSYLRFASETALRFSNWSEDFSATVPKMSDGAWHHVVVVYDSAARRKTVWFDGAAAGTTATGGALDVPRSAAFQVGHGSVNGKTYSGDMDELQVFNYALSADEVASEFALAAPATTSATDLLPPPAAHWTFDDEANPGADASGSDALRLSAMGGDVALESGEFICGKAARFSSTNAWFTLADFPKGIIPTGAEQDFSVVVRYRPDSVQISGAVPSIVSWGDFTDWTQGRLFKFGSEVGRRNSIRATVGNAVFEPAGFNRVNADDPADRRRWIVATVVYSAARRVVTVYSDGREVVRGAPGTVDLQPQEFAIGAGFDGGKRFYGLVDDIRIYDATLSAGEVRLLAEQYDARCGVAPYAAGPVLVRRPDVSVSASATLDVRSDETVASLSGAGTVAVAPHSTLSLMSLDGSFSGTVMGAGALGLADCAVIEVSDETVFPLVATTGRFSVSAFGVVNWTRKANDPGWVTVVSAAGGVQGVENFAHWTMAGRNVKFRVSPDGKSLQANASTGLAIVFR